MFKVQIESTHSGIQKAQKYIQQSLDFHHTENKLYKMLLFFPACKKKLVLYILHLMQHESSAKK